VCREFLEKKNYAPLRYYIVQIQVPFYVIHCKLRVILIGDKIALAALTP